MERELDRIVEELDDLDALHRPRVEVDDEREVERAVAKPLHALARVRLLHAELDPGVTDAEGVDRLRQHVGSRRGEASHAQAPALELGELRQRGLCGVESGQDRGGVLDQRVAGFGEHHAAGAALQERCAGLTLERGDLLRDGRRRIGEAVCRPRQRPAARDLPHTRNRRTSSTV